MESDNLYRVQEEDLPRLQKTVNGLFRTGSAVSYPDS